MAEYFEATLLDDASKERLCRDLLAEFGVTRIRQTVKGELIHSCPLPFGNHAHGDRNPSASLNFRKLTFNCLGCQSSGGLLWFIACCRGEDGLQARKWLEEQTGLGQTVMDLSKLLLMIDGMYAKEASMPPPIPSFAPSVLDPWQAIHPYLTIGLPEFGVPGRGIPEATLERFRVGYAEQYPMGLDEDGDERPPQERVVIPHWWHGSLVGWQARALARGDEPKYKASPDFPRDRTIFNYQSGVDVIVVESPMSVLRHWHHQPTMMATFGAKVTEEQLGLLRRAKSVTVWMDPDKAGWKATRQLIRELPRHTVLNIVDSPWDADPGDLDDEAVDKLIADAVPWGLWTKPEELKGVAG